MNGYKPLIRKCLSSYIHTFRKEHTLTQEEMAERLHISSRAYSDLERGKYSLYAATLLFLLLMLNENELKDFLSRFQRAFHSFEHKEVA